MTEPAYLAFISMALLCCSCSGGKDAASGGEKTVLMATDKEVTVSVIEKRDFYHESVCNGKIEPLRHADLYFGSDNTIARIWVKNGDRVKKGDKIAELDLFSLQNKVLQDSATMYRAKLDMQDVLIGRGYIPKDNDSIPAEVMELAGVKSGYLQSKAQYELSLHELSRACLRAPFDGVIANLSAKEHNRVDLSKPFCRVVGTDIMEVGFKIMENELPFINKGDDIEVVPYSASDDVIKGRIVAINPIVDKDGMIEVRGEVYGVGGLISGMNVKVNIKQSLGDMLVVPKTAVVTRGGRQVVFTLKDSIAFWNYVKTGFENIDEYSISQGLNEGDTVIVDGNINLSHESVVKVVGVK